MNPTILLCTVGTSILNGTNVGGKRTVDGSTDWEAVSADLAAMDPTNRAGGAEVNSVASLISHGHVPKDAGIYLFHSDTEAGRQIATILSVYFLGRGHSLVQAVPVIDLQGDDPKRFRTKGLRNLVKAICGKVRDHSAPTCAINATGGYKAQIAIAVLLGQALGISVYYMHERFSEIIPFPPLPVALDFQVWMKASGLLATLEREPQPKVLFQEEWDEKYESLVDAELIDGTEYLELSPTGQIFQETFRERFRTERDQVLPAAALKKHEPHFEKAGWPGTFPDAVRFLKRVTSEIPCVTRCSTWYYNPDLVEPTRFRPKGEDIEGIFTDGSRTVKFNVETTAKNVGQHDAVVAALNEWVQSR